MSQSIMDAIVPAIFGQFVQQQTTPQTQPSVNVSLQLPSVEGPSHDSIKSELAPVLDAFESFGETSFGDLLGDASQRLRERANALRMAGAMGGAMGGQVQGGQLVQQDTYGIQPAHGAGLPFGIGNPVGFITDWVGNMVGGVADDLGLASGNRVDKINNAIKKVSQNLTNLTNRYMGTERVARTNNARLNVIEEAWNKHFGEEGVTQRAVLAAAQALPGIVARNVQQSDANKAIISGIEGMARTLDRADDKPPAIVLEAVPAIESPTAPGVYSAALIDSALDKAYENSETLQARIEKLEDILYGMRADFAEAKVLENAATMKTHLAADSITDLAKIAPSQWFNQTQAMWESGLKLLLGRKGQSGGLLGLGLSV